ncbi:hypothetical protein PUV54_11285 [Hyphococcus flavus]|uniref:Uncharacterized protein n=1 Tax=Hyphococcus flavus TaxID=1866326 RepID=A0AAF0CEP7_9PROT|nr:hypothetical protein [Hyphococcus flavus]WDI30539.1 hypothetical protein PUV54_11285 [Hyphococcus flavus]
MSFIADILTFPLFLMELAWGAIGFSTDAFLRAASSAEGQTAALIIAFLAGVSEMLGQSVILVVNRVALYRFLASLAFTGLTYVITAVAWGAAAIAVAPLTRVGTLSPGEIGAVTGIVSLAFAPRLFGVFAIAPYFGLALGNILEVWAMTLAIFGLHVGLDLPLAAAVFCGGVGWALSYGIRSWLGHALATPLGRLRHAIIGSPLDRSPQQIIDDLAELLSREKKSGEKRR